MQSVHPTKLLAAVLGIVLAGSLTDARLASGWVSHVVSFTRGRCLIVSRGGAPESDWSGPLCEAAVRPAIRTFPQSYAWLPDCLERAAKEAEVATSGAPDCALQEKTLRFYVLSSDLPVVGSRRESSAVSMVLTTGAVDLIETAGTALSDGQLTAWLSKVDGAGPGACRSATVTPPPGVDRQRGRAGAIRFYELVVARELARLRLGESCGQGQRAAERTRDAACWHAACDSLACDADLSPAATLTATLALAHVESLDRHVLLASDEPALDLVEVVGPSAWSDEAGLLMRSLEKGSTKGSTVQLSPDVRASMALALPVACRPVGPASDASRERMVAGDPALSTCLDREMPSGSTLQWDTDGDPLLVRLRLGYRNTCDVPIRCRFTTAIGTSPGDEVREQDTRMIPPHAAKAFTRVLSWPRSSGLPHMRLPDSSTAADRTRCERL